MKKFTIKITKAAIEPVKATVNGKVLATLKIGETGVVNEDALEALKNAHVEFEILEQHKQESLDDTTADEEPEVGENVPTTEANSGVDLSILDGTVSEVSSALPGLPREALEELKQAEDNGNTRKGVIKAIDEALANLEGGE